MAFNDNPIVDKNSERSEESIHKTHLIFSRKNGFISHDVDGNKDYGVDIYCQLTYQGEAGPNTFPIQVKSVQAIKKKTVDSIYCVRLSFKTSRLGYLMRHSSSCGLIIIYDDTTGDLYGDFVMDIYNKIRVEKKNNQWKENEDVTISIPTHNKINSGTINKFHSRLYNLFRNFDRMKIDHGYNYSFPFPETNGETTALSSVQILEKYGELLFNSYKLREIIQLISRLNRESLNNKIIVYIGAITYTETGNTIEADYFFRLSEKYKPEYSDHQQEVLEYQNFKNDFYKGVHSNDKKIEDLKRIKNKSSSLVNSIYAEINIVSLTLLNIIGSKDFDESIIDEIERLINSIKIKNTQEDVKHLQLIFLSELLSKANGRITSEMVVDTKIYQTMGLNPATEARVAKVKKITSLNTQCHEIILEALHFSEKSNNDLILAHGQLILSFHYFDKCYPLFLADHEPLENYKSMLTDMLKSTMKAYNIFMDLGLEPFAFNSLILAIEIHFLARRWLNTNLENVVALDIVEQKISWLNENGFSKPFESMVEKSFQTKKEIFDKNDTAVGELTEEEIENIVKLQMRSLGLPKNRYKNIFADIKASSIFYARCKNKDLVLASDQNKQNSEAYKSLPKFRVFSKTTNLIYSEGFDIEKILREIGY